MDRQAHDYAAAMGQWHLPSSSSNKHLIFNSNSNSVSTHNTNNFLHQFMALRFYPHILLSNNILSLVTYNSHTNSTLILPGPHPRLLHLQQQQQPPPSFPPHLAPHLGHSPLLGLYNSPLPPVAPLSDPELQKCIDKLVKYTAKNGPEFEAMIREKQQDNPAYSFLFGSEWHNYYRYKLWLSTQPLGGPFNPPFPSSSMLHPPNPMMSPSPLNAPPKGPQLYEPPFPPPLYEQRAFVGHGRLDYDQSSRPFKGLFGPLPSDIVLELNNVLNSPTGTKESIKAAKIWFMQRSPFAPAVAEALRDRVFVVDDSDSSF